MVRGKRVWVIAPPPRCPKNADCAQGVTIDGKIVTIYGGQVQAPFTHGELVAVGADPSLGTEVRRLPTVGDPWLPAIR
jgi:hypothetical protein